MKSKSKSLIPKEDLVYDRKVKSVELALKAGKGMHSETIIKIAKTIYEYVNSKP